MNRFTFLLFLAFVLCSKTITAQLQFHTNFEGGNGIVKIKGDSVWIKPDLRDTEGDWFYWNVAFTAQKDGLFTFILPDGKIPSFGPAVSYDSGNNWSWLYNTRHNKPSSFQLNLKENQSVRLSIGFEYTLADWKKFIKKWDKNPAVKQDTLYISKKNEAAPLVYLKGKTKKAKKKIVITARHHACEMMANYVMEGLMTEILRHPKKWLDNYEFMIVPFVDFDGVQAGDQGKGRYPRDHNRDYSGESIHPSTKKLRQIIPAWADENLAAAIDIHCPALVDWEHERLHIMGSKNERIAKAEINFSEILHKQTFKSPLVFPEEGVMLFGYSWNNDKLEYKGDSFKSWIQKAFPCIPLTVTFEVPYSINTDTQVTPEKLHVFGQDILFSLDKFFKTK